ncbi:hypothetical protein DFQ11_101406 [Winogradskyella epiphytica]|uniref:TonB-like protein n=1 Tax=Winogradskyella epiphytica TaxID=262005 RepID=A0A2V4WZ78_9FLAO|nr:hypothetical protein [Winogradskyella epiphytica]PYE82976.1 hypothetical protein DFQ11_101406 [Winogradskyella epiphytica]GGW54939.1 hypothetical protein GCM10008085_02750 [Winogradskyella epiphytica]
MNRIVCLLILLLASSCDYFEKKKVYPEDLLKEELQTFNWNEVDTYPTFSNCDSMTTKEDLQACFQNTLIANVNDYLKAQNFVVSNDVNDTISLKIQINTTGLLEVQSIKIKPETVREIPEIDSLLHQSLNQLPKIYPAIKRGQQVTTAFELPVIVKIN